MNSLKITGLFGLIGSVMVGIGEFLLHFNAGGYGGDNYSFFVSISDNRLIAGHFLVVFFMPFYIAGYWHFYLVVRKGSHPLALATPLTSDFNNDGYPDLVYININGESKAFINNGGKANFLKVRMPDTNEALGAKVTVNFSDNTTLTNWNMIGEGLSVDQSNTLQFAIGPGKKAISVVVKYNSNRIDTIKNIQPNSTVTVK